MARDGSTGTFSRLFSWVTERDAGNPIDSTDMDSEMDGMATALTDSIAKDGQTTATANLPMGGFKHTGVATATARNHYAATSQVQDSSVTLIGSVSGTDTITGSLTPTLTAYAAGQVFSFAAAATNTGAVTLNINSVGAKSIIKGTGVTLAAGDLPTGEIITVVYDGTAFRLLSYHHNEWEFVAKQTASSTTWMEYTDLDSGYDHMWEFDAFLPESDITLRFYTSPDTGGSPTYDSGASDYSTHGIYYVADDATATAESNDLTDAFGSFTTQGVSVDTGHQGYSGTVICRNPVDANTETVFVSKGYYRAAGTAEGDLVRDDMISTRVTVEATNAVRFGTQSGTADIVSGTVRHYRREIR